MLHTSFEPLLFQWGVCTVRIKGISMACVLVGHVVGNGQPFSQGNFPTLAGSDAPVQMINCAACPLCDQIKALQLPQAFNFFFSPRNAVVH